MRRAPATEETVVRLWEAMAGQRRRLVTAAGEHLHVLFPGRRNRGPGPDFRDAVLTSATGRIVAGDVEVHVSPREWNAHGHQRDPQYNNLVLHVVLRAGAVTSTTLELGFQVPLVALENQESLDGQQYHRNPYPASAVVSGLEGKQWCRH